MIYKKIPDINELRNLVQAEKMHRTEWHYIIHRKISVYITWLMLHTNLTANAVTILSILFGLMGAVIILSDKTWFGLLGFILVYLYFILDKVDGEIARFYNKKSISGVCLDYIGHMIVPPFLLLCVSGYLANASQIPWFWSIGAIAALSCMFVRGGRDILLSVIFRKYSDMSDEFKHTQERTSDLNRNLKHTVQRKITKFFNLFLFSYSFWIPLLILAVVHSLFLSNEFFLNIYLALFTMLSLLQLLKALILSFRLFTHSEDQAGNTLKKLRDILSQ